MKEKAYEQRIWELEAEAWERYNRLLNNPRISDRFREVLNRERSRLMNKYPQYFKESSDV